MEKVVFLDRDGTINREISYLYRTEDLEILPGVPQAIALLREHGYRIVVVTNQAGVARGYYQCEDVEHLHEYLNQELKKQGAWIDEFFYCPHHPEHGVGAWKKECACRKPGTGMFEKAAEHMEIDKNASWMIGDKLLDVEAGHNFGIRGILVGTGYGSEVQKELTESGGKSVYDHYAETLLDAARYILEMEKEENRMKVINYLEELMERYPVLAPVQEDIWNAYEHLKTCYEGGGKLLVAGNGGSCADAEHIVGELMKGFVKKRPVSEDFAEKLTQEDPEKGLELAAKLQGGLLAIALNGHPGLSTAYLNDVDGNLIYAQQTYGYGKPGDVLLAISTSGNSRNIEYAVLTARALGMKVIGLTGRDGGKLGKMAHVSIVVPETETYKIQELHLPVYHALCLMLEETFFEY